MTVSLPARKDDNRWHRDQGINTKIDKANQELAKVKLGCRNAGLSFKQRSGRLRARFSAPSTASLAKWLRRPEFESRLRRYFSGSSHTSDLKIGTPVATLPAL